MILCPVQAYFLNENKYSPGAVVHADGRLLSDNGTEFCNELNDTLNEVLGIKKRLTIPYHPQVSL